MISALSLPAGPGGSSPRRAPGASPVPPCVLLVLEAKAMCVHPRGGAASPTPHNHVLGGLGRDRPHDKASKPSVSVSVTCLGLATTHV